MGKNIRHIMRSAIMTAFRENIDKHSMKKEGLGSDKVCSYSSKFQLLDRVNDLCQHLPVEIKKVSQITPEHLYQYLMIKADHCSQRTLDEYRSEIRKLGNILGVQWHPDKISALRTVETHRGSSDIISKEDWNKILEYAMEHLKAGSNCVIALEKFTGVRVGDACYGVHDCGDYLRIRCKNGKWFDIKVTPDLRAFLSAEDVKIHFRDGVLRPCKDASVNRQLNRIQDKLGIERHSFHSIRRRLAQDRYDKLRESGVSKAEALAVVSISLNHGERRDAMLAASYLADIW